MKFLLDVLSGFHGVADQRKRILEIRIEYLETILLGKGGIRLTPVENVEIARSVDNLRAFLKEEKSYVVVQLFKQAFEAIGKLDFLSGTSRIDGRNLYDEIINHGRIVVVSIPPRPVGSRKRCGTLMKMGDGRSQGRGVEEVISRSTSPC